METYSLGVAFTHSDCRIRTTATRYLLEGVVIPSGVIMANYNRVGEVKTGTVAT